MTPRERVERVERRTGAATFRQGDHRSGADRRRGMLDAAYYAWRDGSPRPRSGTDRRQAHARGATPETWEGLVERLARKRAARNFFEFDGLGDASQKKLCAEVRDDLRAIADEMDAASRACIGKLVPHGGYSDGLVLSAGASYLRTEASR